MNWKVDKLLAGETIISKEPGNSMLPLIKSKQPVKIEPTTWDKVQPGDIVYCKVRGRFYTKISFFTTYSKRRNYVYLQNNKFN